MSPLLLILIILAFSEALQDMNEACAIKGCRMFRNNKLSHLLLVDGRICARKKILNGNPFTRLFRAFTGPLVFYKQ